MAKKKALSGNKGEWSEIYAFFYVLAYGKLDVADENLNAVPGEYYRILEILRNEAKSNNRYIRNTDVIHVHLTNCKTGFIEQFDIRIDEFERNSKLLFNYLKTKKGRSFQFPDIESFLSDLHITSIKDVGHKRDITIKIQDFHCGLQQTLGFSIKSLIGQASTLFNPGAGTNFIYEIIFKDPSKFDIDRFNKETYVNDKIHVRLTKLEEMGAKIEFVGIQSNTLYQNLRVIDGDLPKILAHALLLRYKYKGINKLNKCVEKLQEMNPMGYDLSQDWPFYEYKIKRFLLDVAMGMTPETVWTGFYDATGGQIIVKDSGDVVCYHIYEQNQFLNFLINSTTFEQPSTSEDENNPGHSEKNPNKPYLFGWVYEENGRYFIKINLQVRMREKKTK